MVSMERNIGMEFVQISKYQRRKTRECLPVLCGGVLLFCSSVYASLGRFVFRSSVCVSRGLLADTPPAEF